MQLVPDEILCEISRMAPPKIRKVSPSFRDAYDQVNGGFQFLLRLKGARGRAACHERARRLGFGSASCGVGKQRRVRIWHPTGPVCVRADV